MLNRDPQKIKGFMEQEMALVLGKPALAYVVVREHCEELEMLWRLEDPIGWEMSELQLALMAQRAEVEKWSGGTGWGDQE